jgi:hypothetical protein
VARVEREAVTWLADDFDAPVQLLDVGDRDLLVAGLFSRVGDVEAGRIARYAGGEWTGLGDGLVGQPLAIARDHDATYASTYDDGQGAYLLGAFDGTGWRELAGDDSGLPLAEYYSFNQILPVHGGLVLVGTAELEEGAGRGALLYRDGRFTAVGGGGVHGISLSGAAAGAGELWIGGTIAEVASDAGLISSVGIARLRW